MTQRSKAVAALAATLAAAFLGGCGGDGDGSAASDTPDTYTLAVRPHLGAVQSGAMLVLQTLLGSQQFTTKVPASGDPVFKIPRQYCGPGMVALVGSDSTVYFDEGTNRNEVLGEGNHVRALVPDICDVDGVMSLSMLDEIALHMSSGQTEGFRRVAEQAARGYDPVAGVDPQVRAEAVKAARALRDDVSASLGAVLGLPANFQDLLPTMIDSPSSVIPKTPEGQIAATLRSIQEAAAEARRQAIESRQAQLEAQAALIAEQANRLRQQAMDRFVGSVISGSLAIASGPLSFQYGNVASVLRAQQSLGAGAVEVLQNVPSMLDRVQQLMPSYPPAAEALGRAIANARAEMPVANADLTVALRTALTPMLLRAEPVARFHKVVSEQAGTFACTVGDVTRGLVAMTFADVDLSGGLSSGDRFELDYRNCIVSEPLSGVTLAKTGTMQVIYDDFNPDVPGSDLRGHVSFEMRFHAGETEGSAKTSTLYRATGSWVDRVAFGAPAGVPGLGIADASPVVLLDDATLTLSRNDTPVSTQLGDVRLDMTSGFDSTNTSGSGQAVLRAAGMADGVGYTTPSDMVFVHSGSVFGLREGSFVFSREFAGSGSGTIARGDGNLFKVSLVDGAGVATERRLTWPKIIAAYLAGA